MDFGAQNVWKTRKSTNALTFVGRVAAGAGAVGGVAHGAMSVEGERFCDLTVSRKLFTVSREKN